MSPPPIVPRALWQNNNKNPAGGNDPPPATCNILEVLITLVMPLALLIVAKNNTERGNDAPLSPYTCCSL